MRGKKGIFKDFQYSFWNKMLLDKIKWITFREGGDKSRVHK